MKTLAIAYVRFSDAPPGGYLVCDEVRLTPLADAAKSACRMSANEPRIVFIGLASVGKRVRKALRSSVTDAQWETLDASIPDAEPGGNPRELH